ncbi:DUF927 domain-containing protein [Geomesophilobacter sediminis]|uniref:DUF927 domain-containing protein n=1 Tax=Geomesophilobacter sediminis TaxID=2798584 RepID=A0A8J7IN11_9BACT|nr:DUF927 domain-containing protein [Geomesophilobacter sediminis]MBJ6724398.1 DUF927 domain-containing protein [Geomesophilobacter sediminis]
MGKILEMLNSFGSATQQRFVNMASGVFFIPQASKKGETPDPIWLSSPLEIVAFTRDTAQENWGRLLSFHDPDGHRHQLSIPMAMLSGGGEECLRLLLSGGLTITTNAPHRKLLISYIQEYHPKSRTMARCTDRIGWHQSGTYVLPEQSFGSSDELIIYQSPHGSTHAFEQKGELADWQRTVGGLCIGNSRLAFAVSAAFAGPLLSLIGAESGGFNFCGGSSSGKTTALQVAISICGGPKYMQRWRGTVNGLEATAALHNDGFLALDELAQVDPRVAGEVVYMIANESGKARATKTCGAKQKATWRLIFLSAGEISLSTHMASAGKESMAGQETRLADVPADAGKGFGIFENLHGIEHPSKFADVLKQGSATHYGTPLVAWLEKLTQISQQAVASNVKAKQKEFLSALAIEGAGGQVYRVAERFAIVAAAGEVATGFGITGWEPGEAFRSATSCFRAWLDGRGGTDQSEYDKMKLRLRHFLEQHGDSRFTTIDDDRPVPNRAGFRSRDAKSGLYEYYILTGCWKKDVCAGFDSKAMARYLAECGFLKLSSKGEAYVTKRFPGLPSTKCYHVLPSLFDDSEPASEPSESASIIDNAVIDQVFQTTPVNLASTSSETQALFLSENVGKTSNKSNVVYNDDDLPF